VKLLPTGPLLPKWTRNLIQEPKPEDSEGISQRKPRFGRFTTSLFITSTCGLALQIITIFFPLLQMDMMIYLTIAWAIATFLVCITRPTTTPKALLALYISILISKSIILFNGIPEITPDTIPSILVPFAALGAILIILNMPLRDPSLPSEEISPVFATPGCGLRSPEDNLTLWQYMSVSWMEPLIKLGNSKQLNDTDVWSLGYEFQHRLLHDRFRELKGTVLSRLIEANALDLIIITVLSIIELFASMNPSPLRNLHTNPNRLFCTRVPTKDPPVYGESSFTQTGGVDIR
jgi:hypothetical protein